MLREETNGAAREAVAASGRLHLSHVEPIVPLVHWNGSGSDGLIDPLVEAIAQGRAFSDALAKTAPHGRDYYPLGDAALARAQGEHHSRMHRLNDLLAEAETIALAVHDQGRSRERAA
jgi:hypothetical protein